MTFLPLRYILDNIVLTQETLHWAKVSRQPLVFLQLEFAKAYDKVSWRFLFLAISKMCINEQFVGWVKLFFGNASAAINLNDNPGKEFKIKRSVRQGCPLAPYIFLVVGEVLLTLLRRRRRKVESEELRYPEVGDNKVLFNTRTIPHL